MFYKFKALFKKQNVSKQFNIWNLLSLKRKPSHISEEGFGLKLILGDINIAMMSKSRHLNHRLYQSYSLSHWIL